MLSSHLTAHATRKPTSRQLLRTAGLLVLALSSLSLHAQTAPASAPPQAHSVEQFLQAEMARRGIPGMQVAVVQHGKIVLLRAYGLANIENSVPVTDRSVFPINSITKAFTGVAAMQLVEAGKLDLDAPASRYLDNLPADWRAITVRQLFGHTSGLPDIIDADFQLLVKDDEAASWAKVQTLPVEAPPGTRFKYNHTNYFMLGRIINQLAGEPFTQLVKQGQLDVVGMPSSRYADASDVVPHSASMYLYKKAADGSKTLTTRYEVWSRDLFTATGVNTTAEDLARWTIALQQGQLLKSKGALKTLWTPDRLNDGTTAGFSSRINGYAIGWPTVERPQHRALMSGGGARAGLAIYPDDDLTIIVLTNLLGASPVQFIDEVAAFYIPDMRKPESGAGR